MSRSLSRRVAAAFTAVVTAAALAACAGGGGPASPIRVGWSGEIPPLDPAATDSVDSFAFLSQLYPTLLTLEPGDAEPVPDLAESAEWTADGEYTVVLPAGVEFANGNDLTASDVKFSVERQLALQAENGAWRQLQAIDAVEIVDETTVVFRLGAAADSRFPFVLAGPAGLVLDEEQFFADELTPDEDILGALPFAGPFSLSDTRGDVLELRPNDDYAGLRPALSPVDVHPGDGAALGEQLAAGSLDVLTGQLPVDTMAELADDDDLELSRASSGRVRMLAFDFTRMPFGTRTETPEAGQAAAVRAAIAELLDREALADEFGSNWVEPLYGYLPDGIPGAVDVFTELRGDGEGGPDEDAAAEALAAAAVATPVELTIHVAPDLVGPPASGEVAGIVEQLDASGLFEVTVVETDAEGLEAAYADGEVQAVFTSIPPGNSDPQVYLSVFRSPSAAIPGFASADVDSLLAGMVGELDPTARAASVVAVENAIAAALPAIPVSQGMRVVFARPLIAGVDLDDSFALDLSRLRR